MNEIFSLGEWIRRRRKTLDLTQRDLAELVGCAVITIAKIEADERRPSREVATLLSEHLQLPPDRRALFVRIARGELNASRLGPPAALGTEAESSTVAGPARLSPATAGRAAPSAPPGNALRPPAETGAAPKAPDALQAASDLVGRDSELAQAQAAWDRVRSGDASASRVLIVSGEPGVGKTRLIQALRAYASDEGQTATGECYAEGAAPYAPFTRILLDVRSWPEHLPTLVLADLLSIAPSLRIRFHDTPPNPPLEPAAERLRLFESVAHFFDQLGGTAPICLLLEDIHWADAATLDLARSLARHFAQGHTPALLVVTVREAEMADSELLNDWLNDLHRGHLSTVIALRRFDLQATRALLAAIFGGEVSIPFAELIYRETQGNPFFIEEVCRELAESGQVYLQDGKWQRKEIEALSVPRNVRLAIQARLHKLPQATQEALLAAAVFGQRFGFDWLRLATGMDEDALIATLDPALRARLLAEVGHSAKLEFSHALVPAALCASLSGLRLRKLHGGALAALAQLEPQQTAALAYHADEAGETTLALTYYLQAGGQAEGLFAHDDANRLYSRGLALAAGLPDPAPACDLHLARARVYQLRGERELQLADLLAADELAERLGDPVRRGQAVLALGEYREDVSEYDEAIRLAGAAIELARAAGAHETEAQAAMLWGRVLTYTTDHEEARRRLTEAYQLGRDYGLPVIEVRSRGNIGVLDYRLGNLDAAEVTFVQTLARARVLRERRIEAVLLINLGNTYWAKGDIPRARQTYVESLEISRQIGHALNGARALSNLGSILTEQRRYTEARTNLAEGMETFRRLGQRWDERVALGHLADVHEALLQLPEAAGLRLESLAIARELGDEQGEAELLVDLSRTALGQGQTAKAETFARQAMEQARAAEGRWEEALALHALAAALAAQPDPAAARENFAAALALFAEMGHSRRCDEVHAELALLAQREGDDEQALAELTACLPQRDPASLENVEDPRLCLVGYRVLCGREPASAEAFLERGRAIIAATADDAADRGERARYLAAAASTYGPEFTTG